MKDRHVRSILKGLSWRIVGTIDTVLLSFFVTGSLRIAINIGAIELVTKVVLYYVHERIWFKIPWGKGKPHA